MRRIIPILVLFVILLHIGLVHASEIIEFGSTSDLLEINEPLGDVREVLTGTDLDALASFTVSNDKGSTNVNQYVRFPENSGKVIFDADERDRVGHFLFYEDENMIFQFELEFEEGLESDINTTGKLDDLLDIELTILGENFTITNASFLNDTLTLQLEGDTKIIIFEDSTNTVGNVKIDQLQVEEATVEIQFTTTVDGVHIDKISYNLSSNAVLGDLHAPPGTGIREYLERPEAMLSDSWDIRYEGLMDTGVTLARIDSAGNDEYDLEYTNQEGIFFDFPLASNEDGSPAFKYGDDDDDLWFAENNGTTGSEHISRQDYFVLSDCKVYPYNSENQDDQDNTCFSHVLRYDNIDTTNNKLTFTDMGLGTHEINYSGLVPLMTQGIGYILVGGVTYEVRVNPQAPYNLSIDLNGDGVFSPVDDVEGKVLIGIMGEGLIDLGFQDGSPGYSQPLDENYEVAENITMKIITLQKEFDEATGDEVISIVVEPRTNNRIGINKVFNDGVSYFSGMFELEENEDLEQALSGDGVFFELYNPTTPDQAEDLTIEYPLAQRWARVFVVANLNPSLPVDTTPPLINITTPINNSNISITMLDYVWLNVTTDENAFCYYKLEYDCGLCEFEFHNMSHTGDLVHTQLLFDKQNLSLSNYHFNLTVRCEDYANNFAEEQINFRTGIGEPLILSYPKDDMVITQDTVFVPGTYNLPNGIIIGADNVVLDCNGASLHGDNESIGIYVHQFHNITIKNCIIDGYERGVQLRNSDHNFFVDNTLMNNWLGIELKFSNNNYLEHNHAVDNFESYELDAYSSNNVLQNNRDENAVFAYYIGIMANNNLLINNTAINNQDGFYFEWQSYNNSLVNASVVNSVVFLARDSHDNKLLGNELHNSRIWLSESNNNIIAKNQFFDHGLLVLAQSSDNLVQSNLLSNDSLGMEIASGARNIVLDNVVIDSSYGLALSEMTSNNMISNNTFRNNRNGIKIRDSGAFNNSIMYNDVGNNSEYNIKNVYYQNITAENNYWGTTEFAEIENKIFDYYENNQFGMVDFEPFLDAPWPNGTSVGEKPCAPVWICNYIIESGDCLNVIDIMDCYLKTGFEEHIYWGDCSEFKINITNGSIFPITEVINGTPFAGCNCSPNWICTFHNDSGNCLEVVDANDCFSNTGWQAHKYWGDFSEFQINGTIFNVSQVINGTQNGTVTNETMNSSTIPSMQIFLDGIDITLWKTITGLLDVSFVSNGTKIAEFGYNFSNGTIDFNEIAIEQGTNETATTGYIFLRGINTAALFNLTKTLYLNNLNQNMEWVCIKDAPIFAISEITATCSGLFEHHVECDGVIDDGYTCSYDPISDQYEITGLKHSGVIQANAPVINNNRMVSSGGGGGGGSCRSSWQCTGWSVCSGGIQTRTCTDINNCRIVRSRPIEEQQCFNIPVQDIVPEKPPAPEKITIVETDEMKTLAEKLANSLSNQITGAFTGGSLAAGGAIIALFSIIIIGIGLFFLFKKK